MNKQITPLKDFPTEVLVMNFRNQRSCDTRLPWTIEEHFNSNTCQWEYWEAIFGQYEIDGVEYDNMIIGYALIGNTPEAKEKIRKKYTETRASRFSFSDEVCFNFEGKYWRGSLDDLKAELDTRPHVPLKGRKEFRRWKIQYLKNKKGK